MLEEKKMSNLKRKLLILLISSIAMTALFFSCDTQPATGSDSSGGSSGGGGNSGGNSVIKYSLTLKVPAENSGYGTISPGSTKEGSYSSGSAVKVEALAEGGSSFLGWYDSPIGGLLIRGEAKYEFKLTEDTALYARFGKGGERVGFTVGRVNGSKGDGTVSSTPHPRADGSYPFNSIITVKAAANSDSSFLGWYESPLGGRLVSGEARYDHKVLRNSAIYARFGLGAGSCSFSITSLDDGKGSGTIGAGSTAEGIYSKGTEITLKAEPAQGSIFVGWYDGTNPELPLSSKPQYSFILNKNSSIYARFEVMKYHFSAAIASGSGRGQIDPLRSTPSGMYPGGTTLTVVAKPNKGSRFVGWYSAADSGTLLSDSLEYSFTLEGRITMLARFELLEFDFATAIAADGNGWGQIDDAHSTKSGRYPYMTGVTMTAIPDKDSKFIGWSDASHGGKIIAETGTYNFDLTADITLYAKFQLIYNQFELAIAADGTGSGAIDPYSSTAKGKYKDNVQLTAAAIADEGSKFRGWYDAPHGGNLVSVEPHYRLYIKEKTTLYAKFDKKVSYQFGYGLTTDGDGSGKIDPVNSSKPGSYLEDGLVKVRALPERGSKFTGWYDAPSGGNILSRDIEYSFHVTRKITLYAQFELESYDFALALAQDGKGSGQIDRINSTKAGRYKFRTKIRAIAVADSSSNFSGWYDAPKGGKLLSTAADYSFELTASSAIYARFELKNYRFSSAIATDGDGKGTIDPTASTANGSYEHNTVVTLKAVADPADDFVGWFDAPSGGRLISKEALYSFKLVTESALYAKFELRRFNFSVELAPASQGKGEIDRTYSTANGRYLKGTNVKVKAVYDYQTSKFIGWYDAPTGGNRVHYYHNASLYLHQDLHLYARFEYKQFSLTANVTDFCAKMGSIDRVNSTANGNHYYNDDITLIALPKAGYRFTGWSKEPSGANIVSNEANYTFKLAGTTTLYPNFEVISYKFSANLSYEGNGKGKIGGDSTPYGSYPPGTQVRAVAIPDEGSKFSGWYDASAGGKLLSSQADYSFKLTSDSYPHARFDLLKYDFAAAVSPAGGGKGSISAGSTANGSYNHRTRVWVEAVAEGGSTFLGWYDSPEGGALLSGEARYQFYLTKKIAIYARFDSTGKSYSFSTAVTGSGRGEIDLVATTADGVYAGGTEITVKAIVGEHSHFVGWVDAADISKIISKEPLYTFALTRNSHLQAVIRNNHYNSSCEYFGEGGLWGRVKESTKLVGEYLWEITFEPDVDYNYKKGIIFSGWYDSPSSALPLSTAPSYTFLRTKDTVIYAKFERLSFNLSSAKAVDGNGRGAINAASTPDGSYKFDEKIKLSAAAESGSFFAGWYDAPSGGRCISTLADYEFYLKENTALYARFEPSSTVIIPDKALESCIRRRLSKPSGEFSRSELAGIVSLNCSGGFGRNPVVKIKDLTGIEHLTGLGTLMLGDNEIQDLSPLAELTNLSELWVGENQIVDLTPLKKLTNLKKLLLSSNRINDISPLGTLTNLNELWLGYNPINDLKALENLTNLTTLRLPGNSLTDIRSLGKLTKLRSLNLDNNKISDLKPLESLTELSTLYLSRNQIVDISTIGSFKKLRWLSLKGNRGITDYSPLNRLTELYNLNLESCGISDITFLRKLTKLSNLYLDRNKLTDIKTLEYLTELRELKIGYNQITDIAPLLNNRGIGSGDRVNLWGNPIHVTQVEELKRKRVSINSIRY